MRLSRRGAGSSGSIVTTHIWDLPTRQVPWALGSVIRDVRRVRALPGARFAKLLGTSRTLSPRGADLSRWMLLAAWSGAIEASNFEESVVADAWNDRAVESWRAVLRPLASRGRWAGEQPFRTDPQRWAGPVVSVTRARLAPRTAGEFWRAVPPVARDACGRSGLLASLGFGEVPLGFQGTLSVWSDERAMQAFAYRGPHRDVIAETARRRWYREELFARFAVLDAYGTIDGCDPLTTRP